jgi:hypothetical protein
MATNGCFYNDLGADYFNRLHPERTEKRAISQLEALGYHVTLTRASLITDPAEIFASAARATSEFSRAGRHPHGQPRCGEGPC